jgi:hypothetical protein
MAEALFSNSVGIILTVPAIFGEKMQHPGVPKRRFSSSSEVHAIAVRR